MVIGGELKISEEHVDARWVTAEEFVKLDLVEGILEVVNWI